MDNARTQTRFYYDAISAQKQFEDYAYPIFQIFYDYLLQKELKLKPAKGRQAYTLDSLTTDLTAALNRTLPIHTKNLPEASMVRAKPSLISQDNQDAFSFFAVTMMQRVQDKALALRQEKTKPQRRPSFLAARQEKDSFKKSEQDLENQDKQLSFLLSFLVTQVGPYAGYFTETDVSPSTLGLITQQHPLTEEEQNIFANLPTGLHAFARKIETIAPQHRSIHSNWQREIEISIARKTIGKSLLDQLSKLCKQTESSWRTPLIEKTAELLHTYLSSSHADEKFEELNEDLKALSSITTTATFIAKYDLFISQSGKDNEHFPYIQSLYLQFLVTLQKWDALNNNLLIKRKTKVSEPDGELSSQTLVLTAPDNAQAMIRQDFRLLHHNAISELQILALQDRTIESTALALLERAVSLSREDFMDQNKPEELKALQEELTAIETSRKKLTEHNLFDRITQTTSTITKLDTFAKLLYLMDELSAFINECRSITDPRDIFSHEFLNQLDSIIATHHDQCKGYYMPNAQYAIFPAPDDIKDVFAKSDEYAESLLISCVRPTIDILRNFIALPVRETEQWKDLLISLLRTLGKSGITTISNILTTTAKMTFGDKGIKIERDPQASVDKVMIDGTEIEIISTLNNPIFESLSIIQKNIAKGKQYSDFREFFSSYFAREEFIIQKKFNKFVAGCASLITELAKDKNSTDFTALAEFGNHIMAMRKDALALGLNSKCEPPVQTIDAERKPSANDTTPAYAPPPPPAINKAGEEEKATTQETKKQVPPPPPPRKASMPLPAEATATETTHPFAKSGIFAAIQSRKNDDQERDNSPTSSFG
jgi:hypothetical protein